jgi:hypothetical protein
MQIWVDADLILEALLHRRDFSTDAEKAFEVIQSGSVRGKITQLGLDRIYSCVLAQAGNEKAKIVVADIQEFLDVYPVGDTLIEQTRLLKLKDPESAIEFVCAMAEGIEAIVTLCPENFSGTTLQVWSADRLWDFNKLEQSWFLPDLSYQLVEREAESVNSSQTPSVSDGDRPGCQLNYCLNDRFQEGWKTWEEVFGTKQLSYRYAFKSIVQRAKKIAIRDGLSFALVFEANNVNNNEVEIALKLYILDVYSKPIVRPIAYKISVLDDSATVFIVEYNEIDDIGIKINFCADIGDKFTVKIECDEDCFTEHFEV